MSYLYHKYVGCIVCTYFYLEVYVKQYLSDTNKYSDSLEFHYK